MKKKPTRPQIGPTQVQHDIDECVIAYCAGGKRLASLTFRAIVQARELTVAEAVILGDRIRKTLATHGYLPIVAA